MDSQSHTHVYGQVWHMIDPICGSKEDGTKPPLLSALVHNNRYGVVVQRTETINSSSILMVPCSTSNTIPHDVNFSIVTEKQTSGRVRALYPVHPRCLDRYVCTLSPKIMKSIEMEIIKLLCPTICEEFENGKIDFMDLDNKTIYEKVATKLTPINMKGVLDTFTHERLTFTGISTDSLPVADLKESFDEFCLSQGYQIMEDSLEFLEYFQKYHGAGGSKQLAELMEIKSYPGLVLGKPKTIQQNPEQISQTSARKHIKWTDDKMDEFVQYYDKFGEDETSKAYNIKPTTAKAYYNRFQKEELVVPGFTVVETDHTVYPEGESSLVMGPVPEKGPDGKLIIIPTTKNATRCISKISNMIRDKLHSEDIYEEITPYFGKTRIFPDAFYKRLQSCIYHSLLDLLGITKADDNDFELPRLNMHSKYLDTWRLLDLAWHNSSVSWEKDIDVLMKVIREDFHIGGIDMDWIKILFMKLSDKFNISVKGIEHMCGIIQVRFCIYNEEAANGN